jgi:hypothetical protein
VVPVACPWGRTIKPDSSIGIEYVKPSRRYAYVVARQIEIEEHQFNLAIAIHSSYVIDTRSPKNGVTGCPQIGS